MRHLSLVPAILSSVILIACGPVRIPTDETKTPPTVTPAATIPLSPTQPSPATPIPPKPKILRINLGTRPDLLDPQKASTNGEVAILQLAYEGLTRFDENGRVVPGAAETWDYSADGKTLTFHLRSGLKRTDGTPLKAKDLELAFKHAVDPRIGAADASFLDDVHGAVAAYSLDVKSKPEDIQKALDDVGVKAVDDTTLVVTFDQPVGYWTAIAALWVGYPSYKSKV